MTNTKTKKAHVVAVDMGYGHQRPAHAIRHLSNDELLTANNYPGIPEKDTHIWSSSRKFYEMVSRFKKVPLIGGWIFDLYDHFQTITQYYPRRDLSRPTIQVNKIYSLIEKGWGKHLIDQLATEPLPLITTFFIIAFMAEEHGYPADVYCLTTDSDISRAWVPKNPANTRIKYLASTERVRERLIEYGIPKKQIHYTGFPLPEENVGGMDLKQVKKRLIQRLKNLDPYNKYYKKYRQNIVRFLQYDNYPKKSDHPLTLSFAIGGAGAQSEIALKAVKSLRDSIIKNKLQFNIITATHLDLSSYMKREIDKLGLKKERGKGIKIIDAPTKDEYFSLFNETMNTTDILWTKPSELSFFAALGIPLLLAPPVGSQEKFNRRWLINNGAAYDQKDPAFIDQWLWDGLEQGWFAKDAMSGFVEMPLQGTHNIGKLVEDSSS